MAPGSFPAPQPSARNLRMGGTHMTHQPSRGRRGMGLPPASADSPSCPLEPRLRVAEVLETLATGTAVDISTVLPECQHPS